MDQITIDRIAKSIGYVAFGPGTERASSDLQSMTEKAARVVLSRAEDIQRDTRARVMELSAKPDDGQTGAAWQVVSARLLASRRLRRLRIAYPLWTAFIRGELNPVSRTSCPGDLQVLGVVNASEGGGLFGDIDVLVSSQTFLPVDDGEEIPLLSGIHYSVEYLHVRSDRLDPKRDDVDEG